MPDNDHSAAKSETEASPGEFDFATEAGENPRVKKRSLRTRTVNKLRPEEDAQSVAHDPERVEEPARPQTSSTSTQPHFASTARPGTPATEPASPHGTRPATLYYSTGANKDKNKEKAPPMKSTTPTTPSASAQPSPSAPVRSAAPASATRPVSVVDYRTNMERQAREQKSIGNLLAIVVYVLIGFFVLGSSLAGYGLYTLSKQIKKQSLTIEDLDKHYAAENDKLNARIDSTLETLTQAQAQIGRQQALILQQQEAINKLVVQIDANAAALRQERATRADEEAELRTRIRDLEYHGPTTQRY